MYNVVICDDEPIIREYLSDYITKNFSELNVDAVLFDGEQVIEHLKNNKIDILITDIRMKNKTGLDVLKYIYEHSIGTQVILITGFQEFEYAKQSLDLHAYGMLTKPINLDELNRVLKDAENIIFKNNSSVLLSSASFLKQRALFKTILTEFIKGETSLVSFKNLCPEDYLNKLDFPLAIVNCSIADAENKDGICWQDVAEDVNDKFDSYVVAQSPDSAVMAVFLSSCNEVPKDYLSHIENHLRIFNNSTCEAKISYYDNLFGLYSKQKHPLFDKYYSVFVLRHQWEHSEFMNEILPAASITEMHTLLADMCDFADKNHGSALKEKYKNQLPVILDKEALMEIFYAVHSVIEESSANEFDITIITDYLEENFSDSTITLEKISRTFGVSYATINRLFKKNVNMTFISYLIMVRINKAKQLIETKKSIKNLSSSIGYNDQKYFSKLFKKHVGVTPSEYLAKFKLTEKN